MLREKTQNSKVPRCEVEIFDSFGPEIKEKEYSTKDYNSSEMNENKEPQEPMEKKLHSRDSTVVESLRSK